MLNAVPFRPWLVLTLCLVSSIAWSADRASKQLQIEIRGQLKALEADPSLRLAGATLHAPQTLAKLYRGRRPKPLWISTQVLSDVSLELLGILEDVENEGLDPEDYHRTTIQHVLSELVVLQAESGVDALEGDALPRLASLELLFSDAFIQLARDRSQGRLNPYDLEIGWYLPRRPGFALEDMQKAIKTGGALHFLQAQKPTSAEYHLLEWALQQQRIQLNSHHWPQIPLSGSPLKQGMRHDEWVPALREYLQQTGDLTYAAPALDAGDFDERLDAAVRRFQSRHGLQADGIVGRGTRQAMAMTAAQRLDILKINLERRRWMRSTSDERYIQVNVAGYELQVIEHGIPVMTMRVIVGMPDRGTPLFSNSLKFLVANPTWEVPASIAVKDKLPIIRKDLSYLNKNGFVVLKGWGEREVAIDPKTLDWQTFSEEYFPYRLRQLPGPDNAMGRIKFMMPNPFNIYLHDTPAKQLFNARQRHFSSGCIRLERPQELAEYLLAHDPDWRGVSLQKVLEGEPQQQLKLAAPFPVHLQYWTAWVDHYGVVQFREDVYEQDRRILEALRGRS